MTLGKRHREWIPGMLATSVRAHRNAILIALFSVMLLLIVGIAGMRNEKAPSDESFLKGKVPVRLELSNKSADSRIKIKQIAGLKEKIETIHASQDAANDRHNALLATIKRLHKSYFKPHDFTQEQWREVRGAIYADPSFNGKIGQQVTLRSVGRGSWVVVR